MKLAALLTLTVIAQTPQPRKVDLLQYLQLSFAGISSQLEAAAERMPDADYGFKPTSMPQARTYGAVIAHAADGMFDACARIRGVANPAPDREKALTSKADISKALTDSIAFCREAYAGVTIENGQALVRQGPAEVPKIAALFGLIAHNAEMFGISTVYLRAKNIVPPGSER